MILLGLEGFTRSWEHWDTMNILREEILDGENKGK